MYKRAAAKGHPWAQYNLGVCYANGSGVPQDKQQAKIWLQRAASQGVDKANQALKDLESGCFITTAVCDSFNKPDDCYELQMFRKFRDSWLINEPDGEELITKYYQIAPSIVCAINKTNKATDVYRGIWKNYLSKCLSMIENGENRLCKQMYMKMVHDLEEEYYHVRKDGI